MPEFDLAAFEVAVQASLDRSGEAFRGRYAEEIRALAGLSREELRRITPSTSAVEKYDQLIGVVKAASRVNASQAALKKQIVALGKVAVKIAKGVPALATLLA